jgi:hypothetical protein
LVVAAGWSRFHIVYVVPEASRRPAVWLCSPSPYREAPGATVPISQNWSVNTNAPSPESASALELNTTRASEVRVTANPNGLLVYVSL